MGLSETKLRKFTSFAEYTLAYLSTCSLLLFIDTLEKHFGYSFRGKMNGKPFVNQPGFCSKCGTILPRMEDEGNLICYLCKQDYSVIEVYANLKKEYTMHFNSEGKTYKKKSNVADGPVVEKQCPLCDNDTMTYATLQLRSADEGQTVFYTCTKCFYKECENS